MTTVITFERLVNTIAIGGKFRRRAKNNRLPGY